MKKQYFYYDDEKRIKIPRASTKQEGDDHIHDHDKAKVSASSSNMTWLRLKDPRIVKVSRTCGGKDRHSKVCTVRGLRDRRVRLSVPTALQLYDLQERLGLTQPSKVIDWLLEAAKHDINGLPPLPPLNLSLIHHHAILSSNSHPTDQHQWEASNSFWKLIDPKEAAAPDSSSRRQHHNHPVVIDDEDGDEDDPEDQVVKEGSHVHKVLQHHHPNVSSSFGGFLNSSVPLGYQWDPNAASATTHDDVSSNNVVAFSSPLSLSMSTDNQSHFASQFAPNVELDDDVVRTQMNHYHMLASTSTPSLYTSMMILNTTTPTLGCPSK